MQVSRWGNSLAVRLPSTGRRFVVRKSPGAQDVLRRLRAYRRRMPADFKFDRLEANER
jgi:antitoxin MazE